MVDDKNVSRKFVDQIWKRSSKWAVWEPAKSDVHIGDYGTINRENGDFEREGNIFQTPELADLVRGHEQKLQFKSDEVAYETSLSALEVGLDAEFAARPEVAQATLKKAWRFVDTIGAVFVAHRPHQTTLPPELDINALTNQRVLQGKHLVTSVTTCSAYAFFLATQDDARISLALCEQSRATTNLGRHDRRGTLNWVADYEGGVFRSAVGAQDDYTVLFKLKRCTKEPKPLYRDSPSPVLRGVDALDEAMPPWEVLDEAGEEEPLDIYEPNGIVEAMV